MESIVAVDMKSFLFSNNLISHHQFGFKPGHSTLDVLILLTQQWMEVLNVSHEIRVALWTHLRLLLQSGILPYSPNCLPMESKDNSTVGFLTSLHSRSQHMALNRILSSPLPAKAGVPQGSVLGPAIFLIFINYLSYSLRNPPYRFANDSTLCHDIPHPSGRQAAASSLSSELDRFTSWSNT